MELGRDAGPRPTTGKAPVSVERLLDLAKTSLDDDKAEDITVIDLSGKSAIADYMLIASGRSSRHVAAIAEHLQQKLKAAGAGPVSAEGTGRCDWVLLDAGDIIVHLFRPEVRAFYNLEKMWGLELPTRAVAAVQ